MSDLMWSPILAIPLLGLVAVAIAVGTAVSLWRGIQDRAHAISLGLLRMAALALLALILLQPQMKRDVVTRIAPQLAVVVDASESMVDSVDDSQPRRAEIAKQILTSPVFSKARQAFDVRTFSFDAKLSELPANAGPEAFAFKGGGSNLLGAVAQVQDRFRGQPLAGIVFISDGLDTTGAGGNATIAGGAPVYTFEIEKEWKPKEKLRRVSLGAVDYPARVVVGWDSEVRAQLVGSGMGGATVAIEFWRDGKKQGEASVAFNEDEQTRSVGFPIAPLEPGISQYELRVKDGAADQDAKNHPFVVEALPPGKRILYIQNSLGFDFKFLRKAIVSDRNLQLQAFVRWGDGRLVSMGERGVPAQAKLDLTMAGLARYSVVILGDLVVDALAADNYRELKEFVNRGGAIILLGGPNSLASPAIAGTALGEISPVKLPAEYREGQFAVSITEAGLRHPVFGSLFANIKDFPSLLTTNVTSTANPAAEVLIETAAGGAKHPVIAVSRFGQGKVVVVLTDTVWRWRLAAKSWNSEKSPYDTFWTQMMDWLIPKEQDQKTGNKLDLFTERPTYVLGERPEVRGILRLTEGDAKPPATLPLSVRTPDDKTFEYTMKQAMLATTGGQQVPGYRAEVEPNVPGVFSAKSVFNAGAGHIEGEARFVVQRPVTELTQRPIDRELLKRVAEQTGGRYFQMGTHDQWLDAIHFQEQQFSRVQLSDIWNHPILLVLLLAMLAGDWVLRKKWNLP